jgi:uncharacterized membrane protein YphA (DoxX/SURF4 family)
MKKILLAALAFFLPATASAHEVYVLTPQQIQTGISTPPFSEWQTVLLDMHRFVFWAFIAFVVVSTVFAVSLWHRLEDMVGGGLNRLKRYAPTLSRWSAGLSLIAAAYYGALFGPELPLIDAFGHYTMFVRILLAALGCMLIADVYAACAGFVLLALFAVAVRHWGGYMLTYANYFGEALVLVMLARKRLAPYAFLILRIAFGIGLLYASVYAKILHNDLALQVASLPLAGHAHSVAYYLGFEPHFLVLGAAIIEVLIGLFFIFGIEIRWTALFMLFWLSMSLWYFGETVWPHLILIGIGLAFFCYGYDRYSVEGYYLKRNGREPVL